MTGRADDLGYVISRSTKDDSYGLWAFDAKGPELLSPLALGPTATYDRRNTLIWIGGYLLSWGPEQPTQPKGAPFYQFRLLSFDPKSSDPLAVPPLQYGDWSKQKFWGRTADFGNPDGGHKQFDTEEDLILIPLGSFLLNYIPADGRGTYAVWNFDPCPVAPGTSDPIPGIYSYTAQGAFRDIQTGHELIPLNNYVLDRTVDSGEFRLWSFDPMAIVPLAHPPVQRGRWHDIGKDHKLAPIGDYILDWLPADRSYRLWRFDPYSANPLTGPVRSGTLPAALTENSTLMGFQPNLPAVQDATEAAPGTIEFMRSKIKHVVYYMLENRSFDHVVGWLHENDEDQIHVIGPKGPYKGASTKYYNYDDSKKGRPEVHLSKYKDGKLSTEWSLEMFSYDPYHDMSDTLRQLFYENRDGYDQGATPDMGGFIWSNNNDQVMQTYSPVQLPVINGLAGEYAVSDEWFSCMPGATDANRSFAVTGSAQQQLNNFMSPPQYYFWPEEPHRPSIWKILWANGKTSWRIYNSTVWLKKVFTYQLFLEGQIPTVDTDVSTGGETYIAPIDTFYEDAKNGTLPAFSYIEPVWVASGTTTSYHPGPDLIPGEEQLNKIYNAIRNGPAWKETLFVLSFDEHGGIFDHVPPPYAKNPWPNDAVDGFRYDLMGPRVPGIVVSPWIAPKTVFRSETKVAYDPTSILATLLSWFGIPRSRWFLGERVNHAPTFEAVLSLDKARTDSPAFKPPYDKSYPPDGAPRPNLSVNALQLHIAAAAVASMARGKLSPEEIGRLTFEVSQSADTVTLTRRVQAIQNRLIPDSL
jgi:phospholipase C